MTDQAALSSGTETESRTVAGSIVDTESALQAPRSRPTSSHSLSADDAPRAVEKTQRERFIEAAREAGCSEDEAVFDENLKRIAKAGPQHQMTQKMKERVRKGKAQ
jgi:hypothetical protein